MIHSTDSILKGGRRCYPSQCPRCQEWRYLPRYEAIWAPHCLRCANAEKARNYRLATPSGPERNLMKQLSEMGILFDREVPVKWYNVDFVVSGTHAIEVDGGNVHTLRDPERETKRLAVIRTKYKLLVLTDGEVKNCKRKIKEFLLS